MTFGILKRRLSQRSRQYFRRPWKVGILSGDLCGKRLAIPCQPWIIFKLSSPLNDAMFHVYFQQRFTLVVGGTGHKRERLAILTNHSILPFQEICRAPSYNSSHLLAGFNGGRMRSFAVIAITFPLAKTASRNENAFSPTRRCATG